MAGLFNTSFQIGGAILFAIVSAVISRHTTAVGGGEAQGILAAMRPTLAILIGVATAGAACWSRCSASEPSVVQPRS